jgi:small subunit ribosomal protein S4
MIGDRKVNVPSYVVGMTEEKDVHLSPGSTLKDLLEKQQKEQPSQESLGTEATDDIKVETPEAPKVETTEAPKEQSPAEEPKVENSSTEKPQD